MSTKNFKTIQQALKVTRKEFITPHYIRIYLTGDDISAFENTTIGVNNKIFIPPKGLNEIHFPEFDYEKMQWKTQPEDIKPVIRTYTHRGIALKKKRYGLILLCMATKVLLLPGLSMLKREIY